MKTDVIFNGSFIDIVQYYIDDKGKTIYHGTAKSFRISHGLVGITGYRDGLKHGLQKVLYANGNLYQYYYENNVLQGQSVFVDKKSHIRKTYQYINDQIHGDCIEYENDKPTALYRFHLGAIVYVVNWYKGSDTIKSTSEYKNGLRHGKTYRYGPFGELCSEEDYEDDYKHGVHIEYNPNDNKNLSFRRSFKDGVLHGPSEYYNEKGSLLSIKHYDKGCLHGEVINFSEDGDILFRGWYYHGFRHGEFLEYNGCELCATFYVNDDWRQDIGSLDNIGRTLFMIENPNFKFLEEHEKHIL